MIKRVAEDVSGLDDLKAQQALAKRQLERHLAGKPAMIDRPGVMIQTEPEQVGPGHWIEPMMTSRRHDLERAADRLEAQNEARRRAYEAGIAGWEAQRRWWIYQIGVAEGRHLCPGRVRHMIVRPMRMSSSYDVNAPIDPYETIPIAQELVYCPCVARDRAHAARECICTHGARGGIYGS